MVKPITFFVECAKVFCSLQGLTIVVYCSMIGQNQDLKSDDGVM